MMRMQNNNCVTCTNFEAGDFFILTEVMNAQSSKLTCCFNSNMYVGKKLKKASIYFSSFGILRWARDYLQYKLTGRQWTADRNTASQFHETLHLATL